MAEVFTRNFFFYAAAAILVSALDFIFGNIFFAEQINEKIAFVLYTLFYVPLGAFGAFVSHRSLLWNKNYEFIDFFKFSNWPTAAFWKVTLFITFFITIFASTCFWALNTVLSIGDSSNFIAAILQLLIFGFSLIIGYLIVITLFGYALPAAAIGEDSRISTAFYMMKGKRFSVLLSLIAAFVIATFFATIFEAGLNVLLNYGFLPEFAVDSDGKIQPLGFITEYLFTLISFFYTAAIVYAITKHYKESLGATAKVNDT